MAKTLCSVRTTAGYVFYLVQNDNNNLDLVTNPIYGNPLHGVVLVVDTNNIFSKEAFLSGSIFNTEGVSVLLNAKQFKSLKDLLEKGFKIPQHQMPNLPGNQSNQMHNMAPVFNPNNQHHHNQHVVNNNNNIGVPYMTDANTMFYGNEYYGEYENSDFIITERGRHNNSPIKDYSQHVGETTYYYNH